MTRETVRVEPISSYLERWNAPLSAVVRAGDLIYVSGLPPFDPDSGEIVRVPFERQAEIVLDQLKRCLEAAGSDLAHVVKCNVFCISAERFRAFNAIYARYFPVDPPARIFTCVPEWTGPFDVEIDCVAVAAERRETA